MGEDAAFAGADTAAVPNHWLAAVAQSRSTNRLALHCYCLFRTKFTLVDLSFNDYCSPATAEYSSFNVCECVCFVYIGASAKCVSVLVALMLY